MIENPFGTLINAFSSSPLAKSAGEVWMSVVGDRIAAYRVRNAATLATKVQTELLKKGVSLKAEKLPEDCFLAWFETAAKSNDDTIQSMFARLLVNASQEDAGKALENRVLETVSRMTSASALVIDTIYSDVPFPDVEVYSYVRSLSYPNSLDETLLGWPSDWAETMISHRHPGIDVRDALEHLASLGIIRFEEKLQRENPYTPYNDPYNKDRPIDYDRIVMSRVKPREHILPTKFGAAVRKFTQ
jgi:hypothetical protein